MLIHPGDIILSPVYFSDHSEGKIRPCLVVSSADYHHLTRDLLLVDISTKDFPAYSIELLPAAIRYGNLNKNSYVRYSNIYRLEQSEVIKKVASVHDDFLREVINKIKTCFYL